MLNTIFNHRSIRNYTSDPIPESMLDEILRAGSRASTTGNMQVYSIIVTTDEISAGKNSGKSILNRIWLNRPRWS